MTFLDIVIVKFPCHLYPGYYADNADNYPVLKLIHSTAADRGWLCAGLTPPGRTSQCGAVAGQGHEYITTTLARNHHHHTRGGKSVQKPFISTFESFQ